MADYATAAPRRVAGEGALPYSVAAWVRQAAAARCLFVAADDVVLETLSDALPVLLPGHRVLPLPAWDSLPYDRARPSRRVTGTRVTSLCWLAEPHEQAAIVVTTPEALIQRIPPADRLADRAVTLAAGDAVDPEWLHATLEAFGYVFDERVDEPGEAAIRPGAETPVRLELEARRIVSIRLYDRLTQRSEVDAGPVRLLPASEAFTVPGETVRTERLLPDVALSSLFNLLPQADVAAMEGVEERIDDWLALVRDSYVLARNTGLPPPEALFLPGADLGGAVRFRLDAAEDEPALPLAAAARRAGALSAEGLAVVLAIPAAPDRAGPIIARRLGVSAGAVVPLATWQDAETLEAARIGVLHLSLRQGFRLPCRVVLAVRDAGGAAEDEAAALERLAGSLRIGDMVVEPDRGLARLVGLAMADTGVAQECLSLEFLGGRRLLLPALEAGRIWRYGAPGTVSPDRLAGTAWTDRRAEAEQEIEAAAKALVQRLEARERQTAPVIEASAPYQRFIRRMPFAAGADQTRAIRSVRDDLAAGRPMQRLVCGDVGFGKTEVALHAAALAALAGHQVVVVAPTRLLARQHLDTFRRRFSGFDLRIEPLIQDTRSVAAKALLREIRDGAVDIVVGTHAALAGRFARLGLVVVDEEQRFGQAQKRALRRLGENAHVLIMTATPLPRSLQAALLGLIDVSLLSRPPVPRHPVRSAVLPFDPVVARTALLREERRGGQSFVVCPRIEDIVPMQQRLQDLVPELSLVAVHGRMPPDQLDEAMLQFASGERDVLLATNIVEAGLDLPNANTMLVWRPDRFGLAQLHQLRGRVGRGRVCALAYLLTDPAKPPVAAAQRRLETVAALDDPGAGFGVALADLDQRGAGNLLGEEQAGHMLLIGADRFRHVLQRAVAAARGETVPAEWTPEIVLDLPAYAPADFIPAANVRLEIYRRLAALNSVPDLEEAREELTDRFGALPPELEALLDLARLRLLCLARGIAAVHAGPAAVALTPRRPTANLPAGREANGRVLLRIKETSPAVRLRRILAALEG